MSIPIKSVIVGTAGHIDHGKSALVEALTGTHPDRLAEERRRGITIDLGFAFLEEDGVRFGFIDVPGHERFVSNMLAGAAGIDLVLLVIAADESVKPQTREHFDICRLLGVKRGVVALTKSDLMDGDLLGLVKLEIEEYLRGSFLERAPIVAVSAKTGAGLPELKSALHAVAEQTAGKDGEQYFRLPIDRAFPMKGFGTVVTGTLISGSVGAGDEVELFPKGARLRVHFHTGTTETIAEVLLHRQKELGPGENALVQLRLQEETLVLPGDRFIVRQFSPVITIGGGIVLDPLARRPMLRDTGRLAFLETLEHGERDEIIAAMAERAALVPVTGKTSTGLTIEEIVARTGWLEKEIREAVQKLATSERLKIVANDPLTVVARKAFEEVSGKISATMERFHKENPLLPGIAREDLRASLGRRTSAETFRAALEELAARKKIELHGELVRRAGAEIALQPEEARAKEQIEKEFSSAGLAVPSVKEVLAKLSVESKRAEKLLQILLREKMLIRVTPELIFHRDALAQLRDQLMVHKRIKGERISVPAFKELTGITRKYAIPLLEYLDRERVTRRAGDERVIL
jgi:selenocysteine-specific elongation factor